MNRIEVKVLNPNAIVDAERMTVAMARLTQRGHVISNVADFDELYNKPITSSLVETLCELPHPTLQKFATINVVIVGASRRFLAQITRHQNEVKFMSGSLQYSDYSDSLCTGEKRFVTPYEVMQADVETPFINPLGGAYTDYWQHEYLRTCMEAYEDYMRLVKLVGHDAAGYAMPQGMRNILVISATPFQWKHMIGQRICRRNTLETQYVMLRCWEALSKMSVMFNNTGPSCMLTGRCAEGNMSCKHFLYDKAADDYVEQHSCSRPTAILRVKFPLLYKEEK